MIKDHLSCPPSPTSTCRTWKTPCYSSNIVYLTLFFYVRYVDDILAIFKSQNHIRFFVNRLKSHSILNFTTEEMQNNKFHFLDIALTVQPNGDITTAVYVKPTDQGIYTNYFSHSPDMYKYSIIKTLVTRALKYSFSWHEFNVEITRLKQIFDNNNFTQIQTEKNHQ